MESRIEPTPNSSPITAQVPPSMNASLRTSATTAALAGLLLTCLTPALDAQWSEQHKLLPDDGLAGDLFGSAVATDGALVAVGAPSADDLGASSGAAYVFGAQLGAQQLELLPSNGAAGDQFGAALALDGGRVAVGAPLADRAGVNSGAVYVFDANTGMQLLELEPADGTDGDQFGYAVAMDAGLVVVGALGAAYVFDASTGQQLEQLLPLGGSTTLGLSAFGEAVDIDAGLVVVGARLENGVSGISGAAYIYDAASGDQLHRLIALNGTAWAFFGACVSIDGTVVAIGAPEAGPKGKHSGAAYIFDATTGQQVHYLFPADGHIFAKFGSSVGVDGQEVVIGAEQDNAGGFSSGAVYLYAAQSGNQLDKLLASDADALDEFGGAVAVAGGVLVSGAARDDDLGDASGSAYVFDAGGTPGPESYCTAGVSASGCQAALSASGIASATAASGFSLTAAGTEGAKDGLFFFGTNGRQANAWGTGTSFQCVVPPVKRGGLLTATGTTGACDGIFAQDLNARWTAKPSQNPGSGALVQAQLWYRDPLNTSNQTTSLSAAVEFTVGP